MRSRRETMQSPRISMCPCLRDRRPLIEATASGSGKSRRARPRDAPSSPPSGPDDGRGPRGDSISSGPWRPCGVASPPSRGRVTRAPAPADAGTVGTPAARPVGKERARLRRSAPWRPRTRRSGIRVVGSVSQQENTGLPFGPVCEGVRRGVRLHAELRGGTPHAGGPGGARPYAHRVGGRRGRPRLGDVHRNRDDGAEDGPPYGGARVVRQAPRRRGLHGGGAAGPRPSNRPPGEAPAAAGAAADRGTPP